jgi:hypothetical protein
MDHHALPTRRAFRPDEQFYRSQRRLGLTRKSARALLNRPRTLWRSLTVVCLATAAVLGMQTLLGRGTPLSGRMGLGAALVGLFCLVMQYLR